MNDLTRPIIGIENRTAQEVFDIMCDRLRAASITPPAPERSKEGVRDILQAVAHIGVDFGYGPYVLEEKFIKAAQDILPTLDDGRDAAAIEIADAVIAWMVKYDLLDADQECRDDDIIAVLNDLAPEASPAPLPVTITPDPAFLHGVCDSLRAAISEYEDRGLYPGARKIMQAQIDALTAAHSKPGEQG